MKPPYEQYTEELYQRFGYLAAWLPNSKITLGDVGKLRRDRFERVTSLKRLNISFRSRTADSPADYEYTSTDAVKIAFNENATTKDVQPAVDVGGKLAVTFKRANAVVFVGQACRSEYVEDLDELGKNVLARYAADEWPVEHVIVTEVVRAESATILISSSDSAAIEFSAKVGVGLEVMRLADASGCVKLLGSSGIGTKIVAAKSLSPLFRAAGVRPRMFRSAQFNIKGGTRPIRKARAEFMEVQYPNT